MKKAEFDAICHNVPQLRARFRLTKAVPGLKHEVGDQFYYAPTGCMCPITKAGQVHALGTTASKFEFVDYVLMNRSGLILQEGVQI